jgi:hypothetical protein
MFSLLAVQAAPVQMTKHGLLPEKEKALFQF